LICRQSHLALVEPEQAILEPVVVLLLLVHEVYGVT
jgi:hypothetical protein